MSKVNYKSTPLVLLLDLDNTIIVDISPQIKEYYHIYLYFLKI